jgi:hypothetical protein
MIAGKVVQRRSWEDHSSNLSSLKRLSLIPIF